MNQFEYLEFLTEFVKRTFESASATDAQLSAATSIALALMKHHSL